MKKRIWNSTISLVLCLILLSGCVGAVAEEQKLEFVGQVMTLENGARMRSQQGVVFICGTTEKDTGKEVPQEYYTDQQMWASVIDLHGDTFLFDGNYNKTFGGRDVSLMEGAYWRYGGHALEAAGTVVNKGANLRSKMEAYDVKNVIYQNLPRRTRLDVKCYFFDSTGGVWYYVEVAGMEGYVHADNVEVEGFEPPSPEDEEDDF